MSSETSNQKDDSFELIERQDASLEPEALAEIQTWLQTTDYNAESGEFRRHLESQAPGTGRWITKTAQYQRWYSSDDHGSLWIKGVPGAGKSVIAASMVEHLREVEKVPVLFFFFRYVIASNKRPRSLIQDWLSQLLPHSIKLQAILQPLVSGELEDIPDQQLWDYLLAGLSSMERVYCIVDALDEMEMITNDRLLERLNDLATFRPSCIKLLMTSRLSPLLQSRLKDAAIVHISLQQDLVGKDIAAFVHHRLEDVIHDEDVQDSLTSTICSRSQGLFLYARLILDQIQTYIASTPSIDIKNLANTLPVGLEEMYNKALFQQAKDLGIDTSVQVFLLSLVTHSSRPLRLNELADALSLIFPKLERKPKDIARLACKPLLEILEDETVQVIHHSFTEFLLGSEEAHVSTKNTNRAQALESRFPVLESADIHKRMTMTCLQYLQSGVLTMRYNKLQGPNESFCESCDLNDCECFDRGEQDVYDYEKARLQNPLLQYAVQNWAYHASYYDEQDEDFYRHINNFVNPKNVHFRRWVSLEWSTKAKTPAAEVQPPFPLHIAAFAGLTEYAKYVLRENKSVDAFDAENRTPLWWAARRNHVKMVALLLQNGANPDADNCRGVKPLHEAAKNNHASIVKLLLEAGVDLLTPKTKENHAGYLMGGEISTRWETAVEYVSKQGHSESIEVMIPFASPETLVEILGMCARHGRSEALRVVLEKTDVSPNSEFEGATIIYLATNAQSVKCVETLVKMGADVNATSEWLQKSRRMGPRPRKETPSKPLHALAKRWTDQNDVSCRAIFKLLLKASGDLEARDGTEETPLLKVFDRYGDKNLTALPVLLQAGANISATDRDGNTVLHRLLQSHRDIRLTEVLLKHGADVQARNARGQTIWHPLFSPPSTVIATDTLDEVLQFLLKQGAGSICHVKDEHGRTPLQAAVSCSSLGLESFRLLLEACSDDDARKQCLWSISGRHGDQKELHALLQVFVTAGMSLEARDSRGRTLLLSSTHNTNVFKALYQCGAKLDAVDANGRGALHHLIYSAGSWVSAKQLREFVEFGLDPRKLDGNGNTLLHEAACSYQGTTPHVEFIQQLLEYGVPVNARNNLGQTALHIFFQKNQVLSSSNQRTREHFLHVLVQSDVDLEVDAQDVDGLTPLHLAAMRSEVELDRLLSVGADPKILTKKGENVLHLACRARQAGIVGLLLHKTGDTLKDKVDGAGRTPLHIACRSGRPESVYYLIASGVDTNSKDSKGRTPLHACAEFGLEERLWFLLQHASEAGLDQDSYRPGARRGNNVDQWYFSKWQHEPVVTEQDTVRIEIIVSMLLDNGAAPLEQDSRKQTPLDLAILYDCRPMVTRLQFTSEEIKKSKDIDSTDKRLQALVALYQKAPISALAKQTDFPLQEIIQSPERYAQFLDSADVSFLINNKSDLIGEAHDFSRPSLLYIAAQDGLLEIIEALGSLARAFDNPDSVRALVEKAQKKNIYMDHLMPVLQAACDRRLPNLQMLELLIDKCGVDVNAHALVATQRNDGFVLGPTALHRLAEASHWWQVEAIKLLVNRGADVNSRNEDGETPLHIASMGVKVNNMGKSLGYWTPAAVELLLDLGADLNTLDNAGLSPLHKASSNPKILRLLLERGADLSLGKIAPLFSAIQSQDIDSLAVILDAGGNASAVDTTKSCSVHHRVKDQQRTALFCACFPTAFNRNIKDSIPLVKLLIERGADLFAPLNEKETLLHYVFEYAEYPIVCAFLDYGKSIDFNKTDQIGRTVLLAACNWIECLPGYRQQHWVAKETGPVIQLVDLGVDVHAKDKDNRNVLHHILDNPDIEQDTILKLLEYDACKSLIDQKDNQGFTPLQCSLRLLRPQVCERLMSLGGDLLQADPSGATALHHIARQFLESYEPARGSVLRRDHPTEYYDGCLRLWQKYLDLGGDIDVCDLQGCPPLFHYLSSPIKGNLKEGECCHAEAFPRLFEKANVQIRNANGETALHMIAKRKEAAPTKLGPTHDSMLLQFFLERGLDPLLEDVEGRTSLDIAAASGKEVLLDLFRYRSQAENGQ